MVDAIHFVYKNLLASEKAIESFRKFNPNSKYIIICDNGDDYTEISKKYNCDYIHSNKHIGYPKVPYGFYYNDMMEYLDRFIKAVSLCENDNIIIMEDDVHIINNIIVNSSDEMLVTKNCLGNFIHPIILDFISKISKSNIDNIYGMGGGSIFKRKSFIEAFKKAKPLIDLNFNMMQTIYPTIGWTDCIISIIMMCNGNTHKVNPQLHELSSWGQDYTKINYDNIDELYQSGISILHHYKKYYHLQ